MPKSRSSHAELCVKRLKGSFLPPLPNPADRAARPRHSKRLLPNQGRREEEVAGGPGGRGEIGEGGDGQSHPSGYLELQPMGGNKRRRVEVQGGHSAREDRQTASEGCNPKTSLFTTNFTPLKPFREGEGG